MNNELNINDLEQVSGGGVPSGTSRRRSISTCTSCFSSTTTLSESGLRR